MSFFHKIKKAVVSHQETPGQSLCPDYDAVKVEFEGLYESMLRLRQQLLSWREANSRLWMAASALSTDFATMLDVGDHHPYTAMASTLKVTHSQLPSERERMDTMLNASLNPMKELQVKYDALRERMQEHDKMKDEVVYYRGKVETLKKSRAAGKSESEKDKEKHDRNIKKLQDHEAAFGTMDLLLVRDLRTAYAQRVLVFGPIMLGFVLTEKTMVKTYDRAITDVTLVNYDEEKAWVEAHPTNLPSPRQQTITTQNTTSTTTTTVLTDKPLTTTPPVITVPSTNHPPLDLLSPHASTLPVVSSSTLTTEGVMVSDPTPMNPTSPQSRFSDFVPDFASPTGAAAMSAGAFDEPTASSLPPYDATVPYTVGSSTTHTSSSVSSSHPNGTSTSFPVTTSAASLEAINDPLGFETPRSASIPVADDLALDSSKVAHDHLGGDVKKVNGEFDKVDLSSPIGSHDL